ncbi:hypothetical protein ACLOJK_037016 [Asimina triloba]
MAGTKRSATRPRRSQPLPELAARCRRATRACRPYRRCRPTLSTKKTTKPSFVVKTHRWGVPCRAIRAIHLFGDDEHNSDLSRPHADVNHNSKIGTAQALPSLAKLALLTVDSCHFQI